jgi:hypothetical protein
MGGPTRVRAHPRVVARNKGWQWLRYTRALPCLLVAVILLLAAGAKAMAFMQRQVPPMFPEPLLWSFAIVEAAIGSGLLLKRSAWALWAAVALGCVMLLGVGVLVSSGRDVSGCGCFGSIRVDAVGHAVLAGCVGLLPALELWKRKIQVGDTQHG